MKILICDICGKRIKVGEAGHVAGNAAPVGDRGLYGNIVQKLDLCQRCLEAGRRRPVEDVFQDWWRQEAGA